MTLTVHRQNIVLDMINTSNPVAYCKEMSCYFSNGFSSDKW